jgi:hypothetical protein
MHNNEYMISCRCRHIEEELDSSLLRHSFITHRSSLSLTRPNQAQTLPHHVRVEDGVLNQLGELLQRKLLLRQDLSPVSHGTTLCVWRRVIVDRLID